MDTWKSQVFTVENIEEWDKKISKIEKKDIFLTNKYARISKEYFNNEPFLFFFGDENNFIIHLLIKRKINTLSFYTFVPLNMLNVRFYDIISPEYGGPAIYLSNPEKKANLIGAFLKEFQIFCLNNNIVSEFCRINPFTCNYQLFGENIDIIRDRSVVYVDLLKNTEEAIWGNLRKGHKSSIKKAQKVGVKIVQADTVTDIDAFYRLYIETMVRNDAKSEYRFLRKFLDDIFMLLGENVSLFLAKYEDRPIAGALFIHQFDGVHYYFSGSSEKYLDLCPNNLLVYTAILWAKNRGYKFFNLGGGHQLADTLYTFKSGFSKTVADFYIYKKVHNVEIYNLLCDKKREYDLSKGMIENRKTYFPLYRE